jgi:hypothetical protein
MTATTAAMSAAGIGALSARAGNQDAQRETVRERAACCRVACRALDAGLDENLRPAPRYRLRVRRKTPCSPKKFQIQGSP